MSVNDAKAVIGSEMLELIPRANVIDNDGRLACQIGCFLDYFIKEPPMISLFIEIVTQRLQR